MFDNYGANRMVDGKPVAFTLVDTAGQEDYERLRPLSYPDTNVVIICYSCAMPNNASLNNVKTRWVPEIRKHLPTEPIILVGTMADRRGKNESGVIEITTQEGAAAAKEIKAYAHKECSAKLMVWTCLDKCADMCVRGLANALTSEIMPGSCVYHDVHVGMCVDILTGSINLATHAAGEALRPSNVQSNMSHRVSHRMLDAMVACSKV